jgi:hypothetical protein
LKESAHCQFVGVAASLTWRVKTKAQLKISQKFSHTQFVLTRAPEGGQIDRDEARSKIGAPKHHAGDMPAGNARGFRHGCLSLEV